MDLHRDRGGGGVAGDEGVGLDLPGERAWPAHRVGSGLVESALVPAAVVAEELEHPVVRPVEARREALEDNTILRTTFLFTIWVETLEGREIGGAFRPTEEQGGALRAQQDLAPGRATGGELAPSVDHDAAVLATRIATGPPFYQRPWSPTVVGMVLDDATDWDGVADLVTETYRFLRSPEAEAPP